MPTKCTRIDRIAQQLQRELASIIHLVLKDSRVGLITITDVEVSRDLSWAKVFYTLLDKQDKAEATAYALQSSAGFLRSQLARRIALFKMPLLKFIYDHSVEQGMVLSQLIDQAVALQVHDEEV